VTDSKKFPFDLMSCVEVTEKGSFLRVGDSSFFSKRISYHSASANVVEYVAFTNAGGLGAISASAWAIKRITYNSSASPLTEAWAGGSLALNKVEDDKATYTYS